MTEPASDIAAPNQAGSDTPILPGSTTGVRSIGVVRCPACNAAGHTHDTVCTACGEELRRPPRIIKCRHCAREASSELVVCPGCGRELREAPSRILTWGAPVLLVALFFVVLSTQWDRANPISWAFSRFSSGVALVGDLGERIEPEIVIVMTPVARNAAANAPASDKVAASLVDAPAADSPASDRAAPDSSMVALAVLTPTVSSDAASPTPTVDSLEDTAPPAATTPTVPVGSLGVGGARPEETAPPTATTLPTDTPTAVPTATSRPTATSEPTATQTPVASTPTPEPTSAPAMGLAAALGAQPTTESASTGQGGVAVALVPTATAEGTDQPASGGVAQVAATQPLALSPTATPEPTATATIAATPTPVVYEIVAGDTLVRIAARFGVTVEALMAANGIASRDVYVIQPGQLLIVPTSATTEEDEDQSEVPTPSTRYYQVRPGDTLISIAAQNDVTVDALMAGNGISRNDVGSLQPGRLLTIPSTDSTLDVDDSPTPTPRPTVVQPAATNTPTAATDAELRLDAPELLTPEDGVAVSCSAPEQITWQSVRFMRDTDKFLLHLGFVSGRTSDGTEQITWVLAQPRPATVNSWDMDTTLCGLAPQAFGREWRWWIEIVEEVDGELHPVSLPSAQRTFSWN